MKKTVLSFVVWMTGFNIIKGSHFVIAKLGLSELKQS